MTATIELNSARRKLQNALSDNHKTYFTHLRNWFRKRITKEEFDVEAKKLLTNEFHTHNEFLLAILNKCQTLANFTLMTSPTVKNASQVSFISISTFLAWLEGFIQRNHNKKNIFFLSLLLFFIRGNDCLQNKLMKIIL